MRLRQANDADLGFLQEMIAQAAFPPGRIPPLVEAIRAPHVMPWIDGWMRAGDLGIIAEEAVSLGAAWCRRFTGHETGLSGFVDRDTPVLATAIADGHRGQGIGSRRRAPKALRDSVYPSVVRIQHDTFTTGSAGRGSKRLGMVRYAC
jgi:hypothetical protein